MSTVNFCPSTPSPNLNCVKPSIPSSHQYTLESLLTSNNVVDLFHVVKDVSDNDVCTLALIVVASILSLGII